MCVYSRKTIYNTNIHMYIYKVDLRMNSSTKEWRLIQKPISLALTRTDKRLRHICVEMA